MLVVAIIFLTLAVLFGSILLNAILNNKKTPKPIVFLHGSVALFAILVMTGYVIAGHHEPLLIASLVLFVLAALGGVTLFILDVQKKQLPKIIALVHPLVALSGFVLLIIYVLQGQHL